MAAAAHVNAIWADPGKWWKSPDVLEARRQFRLVAQDLNGDWVAKWTSFLRATIA
jgi:hypothetical protein